MDYGSLLKLSNMYYNIKVKFKKLSKNYIKPHDQKYSYTVGYLYNLKVAQITGFSIYIPLKLMQQ